MLAMAGESVRLLWRSEKCVSESLATAKGKTRESG
jgi:hypothetical protein